MVFSYVFRELSEYIVANLEFCIKSLFRSRIKSTILKEQEGSIAEVWKELTEFDFRVIRFGFGREIY